MILVLDLGSSSTRATLYDEQAQVVPDVAARAPVEFQVGEDGRSEDDVYTAFERVVEVLDELHARLSDHAHRVTDLGICSYAASLVCLDEQAEPLTPIYTYADTRCAEDARRLREHHDEIAVLQRTGCRIRANYLPAKLAWIRRTMPEVFRKTRWFASLSDAVCLRLFGRTCAGISIASWSGLLDRERLDWDWEWLDALGISPERLPPIAGDDEALHGLLPKWALRWPRFGDVRCHPPIGDGAAANVGSGCIDRSRIAVTIGSTAAMRVVRHPTPPTPSPPSPPAAPSSSIFRLPSSLWAYRVDHAHELIGGATTEGGNVFAWVRATLNLPMDEAAVEAQAAALQPDAHGLTVLPTFGGERSPGYAENIRATLHGLSFDTSPIEIVRALMEGIAYRLAHICDALRASEAASQDAILIGSGGALQSSATWRQIIADVTGLPLQLAAEPEATSKGVAMLVAQGQQVFRSSGSTRLNDVTTLQPDRRRHEIYRAALARQEELYAKLVRSDG